jgi:hypothetical protein
MRAIINKIHSESNRTETSTEPKNVRSQEMKIIHVATPRRAKAISDPIAKPIFFPLKPFYNTARNCDAGHLNTASKT